jgi:hypothetical protein
MEKKAKVGLIIDDYVVSKQIRELIDFSLTSDLYQINCLIIQRTKRTEQNSLFKKITDYIRRRGLKKFIENALFRVIFQFEKLVLIRSEKFKEFYKRFDLQELNIDSVIVEPNVSKSGLVYSYTTEDLKKIRKRGLDILIRGGSGILRGDILRVCPKGIISFHHANNDINRGGPPGFWEVLQKQRSSGFIIQILKDELDGGDIIFKGRIATSFMYSLNLAKIYIKSNIFMHKALEQVFDENAELTVFPKKPYAYPLYSTPSISNQIAYVVCTAKHVLSKIVRRFRSRSYRWGVAYQFCNNWRDVTLWKSKIIKNPPNRFLADPFIVYRKNKHYCFVEDYDYKLQRGCISVFEISDNGYKEIGVALKEDFHLAYPFIFEHDATLYMCPETHENKDIRIYKCVEFPLRWKLEKVLISNVSACDTNIFRKDGKWWMMTNMCSSGLGDHESELHIFSSKDLLSDSWKPHKKNPVIIDSEKARNGGLLYDNGKVFRVYQKQGWDIYGESFGVAEVTELTDEVYKEEEQFSVEPKFFEGIKGTHTYSYEKGLIAIDFVKIENHAQ